MGLAKLKTHLPFCHASFYLLVGSQYTTRSTISNATIQPYNHAYEPHSFAHISRLQAIGGREGDSLSKADSVAMEACEALLIKKYHYCINQSSNINAANICAALTRGVDQCMKRSEKINIFSRLGAKARDDYTNASKQGDNTDEEPTLLFRDDSDA